MYENETDGKKKSKPKQPAEILDTPRRYLVRSDSGFGTNHVLATEAKPPGVQAALMGTHEDQRHAEQRLGW